MEYSRSERGERLLLKSVAQVLPGRRRVNRAGSPAMWKVVSACQPLQAGCLVGVGPLPSRRLEPPAVFCGRSAGRRGSRACDPRVSDSLVLTQRSMLCALQCLPVWRPSLPCVVLRRRRDD